jgi:hypothetical protein
MFSSRHAVFVGPGVFPPEVREALSRRGVVFEETDVPRLLAAFESASDAERLAGDLQRAQVSTVVIGPEQPPIEDSWFVATSLDEFNGQWKAVNAAGELKVLSLREVTGVSIVDWKPTTGLLDRALLVHLPESRSVFVRATTIDEVSAGQTPHEALRRMNLFVDAASLEMPPTARLRSRTMAPEPLQARGLEGDLLPLALAIVDQVDGVQAMLHGPLGPRSSDLAPLPAEYTAVGATLAWSLWGASLALFGCSGVFLAGGAYDWSVDGLLKLGLGLALAALGSQRVMWSRAIAGWTWGNHGPVPAFPLFGEEPGSAPRPSGLALDVLSFGFASLVAIFAPEGLAGGLAKGLVYALLPLLGASGLAVVEERRRRDPA